MEVLVEFASLPYNSIGFSGHSFALHGEGRAAEEDVVLQRWLPLAHNKVGRRLPAVLRHPQRDRACVYRVVESHFLGSRRASLLLLLEITSKLSLLLEILKCARCDWACLELILLSFETAATLKLDSLDRVEMYPLLLLLLVLGPVQVAGEMHGLILVIGRWRLPLLREVLQVDGEILLQIRLLVEARLKLLLFAAWRQSCRHGSIPEMPVLPLLLLDGIQCKD